VKAETADYLAKAREALAGARQIAALPLPQVAAREAYLAAYHAAEAYIFERTGKTVKTHRGLRATFTRLAREEPRIAAEYLTFLASAYELKSIADYGVGPTTRAISGADARRRSIWPHVSSTLSPTCCRPLWLRRTRRILNHKAPLAPASTVFDQRRLYKSRADRHAPLPRRAGGAGRPDDRRHPDRALSCAGAQRRPNNFSMSARSSAI
jgi:uncharacterized protein (UPF0332 family)